MGQFDAGSIIGTLDVDRSPFTQGLELAKAQGAAFEKNRLVQNIDVNTGDSIAKLAALKAASEAAAVGSGGGAASAAAASGGMGLLTKVAIGLAPALYPIGQVLTGLAGGLLGIGVIAGASFGALSVAAKPFLSDIKSLSAAQTAYNNAVATYGASSAQAKTALAQLNDQMSQATPSVQAGAKAWADFTGFYKTWATGFQPTLLPLLISGLNLAKQALQDITPAIQGIAAGFKDFMDQLQFFLQATPTLQFFKFLGQAMSQLGSVLGGIVANALAGFMALLQAAWPLIQIVADLLLQASNAFATVDWNGILTPLVANFKVLAPIVGQFLKSLIELFGTLLKALAPIGVAMFQVISAAVTALMPVLQALSKVIAVIAPVVAQVAVAFAQFLGAALKAIAPIIIDLLPIIAKLVDLVGGALIGIFRVAGPAIGSILGVLGQFLTAIVSIFDNPAVTKGIQDFLSDISPLTFVFPAIGQTIGQLAPVFNSLVKAFGNLIGPLGQIIGQFLALGGTILENLVPVLAPLVTQTLTALVGILTQLAPFLGSLAQLFSGTVLSVVSALAGPLTMVVQQVLPVLASTLQALTPFVLILAQLFSQTVLVAITSLAGPLAQVVKEILPVLASTLSTLLPYIPTLATLFSQTLLTVITSLAGPLAQVVGQTLPVLAQTVQQLAPFIPVFAKMFSTALVKAVQDLAPVLPKMVSAFADLMKILTPVVAGTLGAIAKVFNSLPGPLQGIAGALLLMKTPLFNFIPGLGAIGNLLESVTGKFIQFIKYMISGKLAEDAIALATKAWIAIQGVFDAVMDANPIGLVVLALAALVAAVILVIKYWTPITDFFKKIWADLKHWFEEGIDFVKQHWQLLVEILLAFTGPIGIVIALVFKFHNQIIGFFENIWHAVSGFFETMWHDVVGFAKGIYDDVTGFFEGLWHDTVKFVSNLVGDVVGFFESLPGKAAKTAVHMWDWIGTSFKSVINTIIGWWDDFVGLLKIPKFEVDTHIPGVGSIGFPGVDIGGDLKITPLAKGGVAFGRTLAEIAEAGTPEAVMPLDRLEQFVNPKETAASIEAMHRDMMTRLDNLISAVKRLPTDTGQEIGDRVSSAFEETQKKATRTLITAARKA